MFRDDGRGGATDALCLAAKETGRADHLLQRCRRRLGVVRGAAIFREKRRGDRIDTLVGALRGENRGDEKLERIAEIELAMRLRINYRQCFDQSPDSFTRGHSGRPSGRRPRALATIARPWMTARRAQANSVARIARPIGMTINAGPGKTIKATPISRTVPPMSAIISLRRGAATNLNAANRPENRFIKVRSLRSDDASMSSVAVALRATP